MARLLRVSKTEKAMSSYLAHILIKEGIINLNQLRAAVGEQKRTGRRLGEVLIDLGYTSEHQLVDFLSKEYGLAVINLDELEADSAVLELIPKKTALKHNLIPISHSGSTLFVAMSDPSDIVTIDDLRFVTGYDIKPVVASERAIKDAIERHYDTENGLNKQKAGEDPVRRLEPEREVPKSSTAHSKWDEFIKQVERVSFEAKQEREREALKPNAIHSQDNNIGRKKEEEKKEEPFRSYSLFPQNETVGQKEQEIIPAAEQQREEAVGSGVGVSQEIDSPEREWVSSKTHEEEGGFKPYSFLYYETSIQKQEDVNPEAKKEDEEIIELSVVASEENSIVHKEEEEYSGFKARQGQETRQEEGGFSPYSFSFYGANVQEQKEDMDSEVKRGEEALGSGTELSHKSDSLEKEKEADSEAPQEEGIGSHSLLSREDEPVREQEEQVSVTGQKSRETSEVNRFNPLEDLSFKGLELDSNEPEEESSKPNGHFSQEDTASNPPIEERSTQETVVIHKENAFSPEPREKEGRVSSDQRAILVIDDSPTIQKIVSITLERQGYRVLIASDGMQAVAKLNEAVPDLIFLDINLPHMDGYQVCKIIKGNGLTKDVPVIMLSGRDGFFDKVRGRMAGAAGYITKPFQPLTLLQTVEKHRREREAKQLHIGDAHNKK